MGWIIAIVVIGLAIGCGVGGAVTHPILYGLFVAAMVIAPLALVSSVAGKLFDAIFGRKR